MKRLLIILLSILHVLPMEQTLANSDFKNPVYYLEFTTNNIGAEVRLNDIPVLKSDDEGTTSSQKPVPESIINGLNTLSIRTFPLKNGQYDNNAYIEAKITVNEKNGPLNAAVPVLQLQITPTHDADKLFDGTKEKLGDTPAKLIKHTDTETLAERSVHIQSPYPRWAWQDGQTIENTEENYNSLLEKYKEIYQALKDENKELVFQLYEPAAKEFAAAYHYTDTKHGHRIMDTGGLIGDRKWILGDINKLLSKREYMLDIHANGKLASLIDKKHGDSPIIYINKNVRMTNVQKYRFYKNNNGEWVMIR